MYTDNTQSEGKLIQKEIDTMTYVIYGKMRNGKTLLAICFAIDFIFDFYGKKFDEPRVYSNFEIFHYGKQINKQIQTYKDIEKIRFSYVPGILIIDESGINANSKDGFSAENRLLQNILFLIGKKNLSLIWIAQRHKSIDVNGRELADYHFRSKKVYRKYYNRPLFIIRKKRMRDDGKLVYMGDYEIDSIGILKRFNITYNQLEESKIKKIKDEIEDED